MLKKEISQRRNQENRILRIFVSFLDKGKYFDQDSISFILREHCVRYLSKSSSKKSQKSQILIAGNTRNAGKKIQKRSKPVL